MLLNSTFNWLGSVLKNSYCNCYVVLGNVQNTTLYGTEYNVFVSGTQCCRKPNKYLEYRLLTASILPMCSLVEPCRRRIIFAMGLL